MAKELRKGKSDLVFPIIHAFFGDSPNPNLDAEIAVFTEQCYQKKEMLKEMYSSGLSNDVQNHSTSTRSPSQIVDVKSKKQVPRTYEKVD
ncbi:MAG: hypothetical protein ACYSU5_04560 [Planctomycetota bacterium]